MKKLDTDKESTRIMFAWLIGVVLGILYTIPLLRVMAELNLSINISLLDALIMLILAAVLEIWSIIKFAKYYGKRRKLK